MNIPQSPMSNPGQSEPIPSEKGFGTFLILWITQSISVFGSALTFFAITVWLTQTLYPAPEQKQELALALSAVGLAYGLPNIFIAPIAGAWADRHDRKRTMIVADSLSAVLSLTLMVLVWFNLLQLWSVVTLLVFFSIAAAFHYSSFDTSYIMIVSEKMLPRANGMMQTVQSLSMVLSPALAATLIALPALARQGNMGGNLGMILQGFRDGTPVAIGIDALTFIIAAITPLFLVIPSPKRSDLGGEDGVKNKSIWEDVREGIRFIGERRPILWLLATFTVANLTSAVLVLQPMLVKYNLGADWLKHGFTLETALALLSSVGGLGGVAGGVFISLWGGLKSRRVYGVMVTMLISALAQVLLGYSPWLFVCAGAAALMESMVPILNAHSQTIWQIQTPPELQGRVFAVRRLIAQFTAPMGTALAGWLGGLFGANQVIGFSGLLLALFCLAMFFNPSLLRIEEAQGKK